MSKNDVINELKSDYMQFRSTFPIETINEPIAINNFSDLDKTFNNIWNNLRSYFIEDRYFGSLPTDSNNGTFYNRANFQIFSNTDNYIKKVLKRHCIITALEYSKRMAMNKIFLSAYNIPQIQSYKGYFYLFNRSSKRDLINLHNQNIDGDKQLVQTIISKMKLSKETDIEKSLQLTYRKNGNSFNTKAQRFHNRYKSGFTNDNVIHWKSNNSQYISYNDCDLAYTLINSNTSGFESAIQHLNSIDYSSENIQEYKNNTINCLKKHFLLAENFRNYEREKSESDKNDYYDKVDTLLFNNAIEKYYNIDLLYEIIQCRKTLRQDKDFLYDNSLYDDILINIAKISVPFIRTLFLYSAINARHNNLFLEKYNESQLIAMDMLEYKQALNVNMQQINWVIRFDKYVEHLAGIYIPLLEKAFVCSLYAKILSDSADNVLLDYNLNLSKLLYNYVNNNFSFFTFNVYSDDSLEYYRQNYCTSSEQVSDPNINPNVKIQEIQDKVSSFSIINGLDDNEINFCYRFYQEIYNTEGFSKIHKYNFFNMYNILANRALPQAEISEKQKLANEESQIRLIIQNYRKEKAALDVKYMTEILQRKN